MRLEVTYADPRNELTTTVELGHLDWRADIKQENGKLDYSSRVKPARFPTHDTEREVCRKLQCRPWSTLNFDRAAWIATTVETCRLDCCTHSIFVTFRRRLKEEAFVTPLSSTAAERLSARVSTVAPYIIPGVSSNAKAGLKSLVLDAFARHVIPALKDREAAPPNFVAWLVEGKKRSLMVDAVGYSLEMALELVEATGNCLDPELAEWCETVQSADPALLLADLLRSASPAAASSAQRGKQADRESPHSSSHLQSSPDIPFPANLDLENSVPPPPDSQRVPYSSSASSNKWMKRYHHLLKDARVGVLLPPDLTQCGVRLSEKSWEKLRKSQNAVLRKLEKIRSIEAVIQEELMLEQEYQESLQPEPRGLGPPKANYPSTPCQYTIKITPETSKKRKDREGEDDEPQPPEEDNEPQPEEGIAEQTSTASDQRIVKSAPKHGFRRGGKKRKAKADSVHSSASPLGRNVTRKNHRARARTKPHENTMTSSVKNKLGKYQEDVEGEEQDEEEALHGDSAVGMLLHDSSSVHTARPAKRKYGDSSSFLFAEDSGTIYGGRVGSSGWKSVQLPLSAIRGRAASPRPQGREKEKVEDRKVQMPRHSTRTPASPASPSGAGRDIRALIKRTFSDYSASLGPQRRTPALSFEGSNDPREDNEAGWAIKEARVSGSSAAGRGGGLLPAATIRPGLARRPSSRDLLAELCSSSVERATVVDDLGKGFSDEEDEEEQNMETEADEDVDLDAVRKYLLEEERERDELGFNDSMDSDTVYPGSESGEEETESDSDDEPEKDTDMTGGMDISQSSPAEGTRFFIPVPQYSSFAGINARRPVDEKKEDEDWFRGFVWTAPRGDGTENRGPHIPGEELYEASQSVLLDGYVGRNQAAGMQGDDPIPRPSAPGSPTSSTMTRTAPDAVPLAPRPYRFTGHNAPDDVFKAQGGQKILRTYGRRPNGFVKPMPGHEGNGAGSGYSGDGERDENSDRIIGVSQFIKELCGQEDPFVSPLSASRYR